jgi:anti-anti-sigma regulatory factor
MDDRIALGLQEDLTNPIEKTGARGVRINISAARLIHSLAG